ncbi:MAG: EamA family transporter [Lachnospiraceae bacterium]|nr:EamA family transporter [Lachnospiraceae bacterium]
MMKDVQKGACYAFISAVLFSTGGLFIKLIPWSGYAINSARNLFAILMMIAYLCLRKKKPAFNKTVFWGAVAYAVTNTCFTLATKMTSAANAIVLQFSAPIFIILIAWLILKKRPGALEIRACAVVFVGIICFFLDSLSLDGITGNVIALVSGISYAVYFSYKDLTHADYDSVLFYGQLISIIVGLPALITESAITTQSVIYAAALGIFQMGLAFMLLSKAIELTSAITASLISTIEPILNPILVAVFYGETIGRLSFVGATIVIVGIATYQVCSHRAVSGKDGKPDGKNSEAGASV